MLFIFSKSSVGLARLLSSVPKSPKMMSNDAFDIICGGFGLTALNYNFSFRQVSTMFVLRGVSGSGRPKTPPY